MPARTKTQSASILQVPRGAYCAPVFLRVGERGAYAGTRFAACRAWLAGRLCAAAASYLALCFPFMIAVMRSVLTGVRFFRSNAVRLLGLFCAYIVVSRLNLFDSVATASALWVMLVMIFLYYLVQIIACSIISMAKRDWIAAVKFGIDGIGCCSILLLSTGLNSLFTGALLMSGVICQNEFEPLSPEFKLCANGYLFRSYYYVLQKGPGYDKREDSALILESDINDWVSKVRENKSDGYYRLKDFGCAYRDINSINKSIIEIWEVCD